MGEALAPSIERSLAFNRGYLRTRSVERDHLEALLMPYLDASIAAVPHQVEQIRGVAEGAGLPFLDVFFANAFEEVYGIVELGTASGQPLERCTDVVFASSTGTLLGHNEQWYAGDDGAVAVVLDISNDGPSVLAPVVAGTLPLVGINELGGAFGTMSLSATDERAGVPRALVARDLLEARDPNEAFKRANLATRAGGYSYLCAFPGGDTCAIETTATTAALVPLTEHTNHATDPGVIEKTCEPSAGSLARLTRATALAASVDRTFDGMVGLLADHVPSGQSICVHPEPDDGDEGSTILFAMICEPESRSMWLAPGHPCSAAMRRFGFDDRVAD
jgi:isopenicillin-N N-acyltransferase-like protein